MYRALLLAAVTCCLAAPVFSPARAASPNEPSAASSGEAPAPSPVSPPAASPDKPPAEPPAVRNPSNFTLLVYFENDMFYDSDRYYTNAVQIRLISPDLKRLAENPMLPQGLSRTLEGVPFPGSDSASQFNVSLGFGQHIYTPGDTQTRNPDPDDRPYAGYLYGLFALHAKQRNRLDTLELAAGMIGPSALGEQAQNEVHRVRGIDTAKGWDHQLRDEPVAMLTWTRIWRLNADDDGGWGYDFLPRAGVSAGTPFTNAVLGGEARFGWNLPPDYGSSFIRPGSGINAPAGDEAARPARGDTVWDNVSAYLFAGGEGKAVAYNSFLDGNLWKDSPSVDKFPLVGEFSAGIAVNIYSVRLAYTYVHRTKEFRGQDSGQDFGSITLGYTW